MFVKVIQGAFLLLFISQINNTWYIHYTLLALSWAGSELFCAGPAYFPKDLPAMCPFTCHLGLMLASFFICVLMGTPQLTWASFSLKAWKSFPANRLISYLLTNQEMMENNGSQNTEPGDAPIFFSSPFSCSAWFFHTTVGSLALLCSLFPFPFPYGTKLTY